MSVENRPNILLIQFDQMAAQVLPSYGHKITKAPNITKLAEEGVVFENAYCNFPICAPSRISMLSGIYTSKLKSWDNGAEIHSSIPTVMHYLRGMNYATTLCGKMHFIGPDQLHGYEERTTTDIYPANFAWTPNWNNDVRERPTGINLSAVTQAGPVKRSLQIDYDDEVEYFGIRKIFDLARYEERPFFLTVSFTQPHSPFLCTQEHWDLYDHDSIDMPTVPPIPVDEMDEMSRWIYYAHGSDLDTPTDEQIKNARHAYYGMVSALDDKVGRLYKALEDSGMADNTIIVMTADHGEMLGERGQWYKQIFYEWSVRVPLIFHAPKYFKQGRIKENVSLVDLTPTLLDLVTGGNAPQPVRKFDGHSLYPFLQDGKNPNWNNAVVSEYTSEGVLAPCRMVKSDDMKFIYTHGYPEILYDLAKDPLELNNVATDPEYSAILAKLKNICFHEYDPVAINEEIKASQQQRIFIRDNTDSEPVWAYKVLENDDKRYVRKLGAIQTKSLARLPRYKDNSAFK